MLRNICEANWFLFSLTKSCFLLNTCFFLFLAANKTKSVTYVTKRLSVSTCLEDARNPKVRAEGTALPLTVPLETLSIMKYMKE